MTEPDQVTAISTWPDRQGKTRPRSATVVIQKEDGGLLVHKGKIGTVKVRLILRKIL